MSASGEPLVVGSEAAGARPDVAALADETVRVPMPGGGESLNAAVAGSILLYVMTRESNVG
jgi:TrmH family RNA methyltransferase